VNAKGKGGPIVIDFVTAAPQIYFDVIRTGTSNTNFPSHPEIALPTTFLFPETSKTATMPGSHDGNRG
jgi:hypothetical protein